MALAENLQSSGIETSRLQSGLPYSLNSTDQGGHRHSWVDPSTIHAVSMSGRGSSGDIQSFNDNDSVNSSPGVQRRVLNPDYNFDAMKRVLGGPTEAEKREQVESQRQLAKFWRNASFEEILRRTEPKKDLQSRLSKLFEELQRDQLQRDQFQKEQQKEQQTIAEIDKLKSNHPNKTIYENTFPELFFY